MLLTVQESKEATERVIGAVRELKKSLMRHLFTYGPVPVDQVNQVEMQETEIGPIPTHWQVVKLGEQLELIKNGLSRRQNQEKLGLPVTRIETISEDRINPEKVGYVDRLTTKDVEKYRLRQGDILFSHINSEPQIGRSVVYEGYPELLLHGMNLLCIRTKPWVSSYFLNYLFCNYRQRGIFIRIAARAVNQSSINQGKMKGLCIPLPPLPEQQEIARILQMVDRKIEAEEAKRKALEELFRSLLHELLTARRRLPAQFVEQFEEKAEVES